MYRPDLDDESQKLMGSWYNKLKEKGFIGVQTPNLPFHISCYVRSIFGGCSSPGIDFDSGYSCTKNKNVSDDTNESITPSAVVDSKKVLND